MCRSGAGLIEARFPAPYQPIGLLVEKVCSDPATPPGPQEHEFGRMEIAFGAPVVDVTGLAGDYSIDLQWLEPPGQAGDHDALKRHLSEQLGLELLPGQASIEMV